MAEQNQSNTTFHLAGRVDATSMPEEGQQAASNTAEQQDQPEAASRALERENMNRAMTAQEEKAISTTMQCGKCKQERVAYTQAQTRSADEPMTTFCECTVCGNRWKFS